MSDQDLKWLEEIEERAHPDDAKYIDKHPSGTVSVEHGGKRWLCKTAGGFILVCVQSNLPGSHPEPDKAIDGFGKWMAMKSQDGRSADFEVLKKWTLASPKRSSCERCKGTAISECGNCAGSGEERCICPECEESHQRTCQRCQGSKKEDCRRCSFPGTIRVHGDGWLFYSLINRAWLHFPFAYLEAQRVGFFAHKKQNEDEPAAVWICDSKDIWRIYLRGRKFNEQEERPIKAVFADYRD